MGACPQFRFLAQLADKPNDSLAVAVAGRGMRIDHLHFGGHIGIGNPEG